jgi:hypothetical protein
MVGLQIGSNCLKYRLINLKVFTLNKLNFFTKLPIDQPVKKLRKEIQRRLAIVDRLGLLNRPKK